MSTSDAVAAEGDDPVEELRAAATELTAAREAVEEFGEAELERLREAHAEFTGLLDRYEEPATGDGDFETFIEFQGRIESFVERLDEDVVLYETFEACDEHLQQRRLAESDFEHVREQLEPVADLVSRLDDRDRALERYRRARKSVQKRLRDCRERIEELRRLERLGAADLDAPTERLREPIETYNDRVTEAFESFRREAPARAVIEVLDVTDAYPLVGFEAPPSALREFVETHPAGEEPIPTLLDYADYSRSKLSHYVDDPDALKRAVGARQTYFRRLDAEPLRIGWPPPPSDRLPWLCRELTAVVNRFAPDVVEHLRPVARLPRETEYERLRDAALAESELTESERERLERGAVAADLDAAIEERDRLEGALSEFPAR